MDSMGACRGWGVMLVMGSRVLDLLKFIEKFILNSPVCIIHAQIAEALRIWRQKSVNVITKFFSLRPKVNELFVVCDFVLCVYF